MYKDKFILSVLHRGSPVKETGSRGSRKIAIPFGSEYKLRLKNKNDRSCAVKLTIDGSPVSNFGDFIVGSGATVDLERYVTDSMSRGKRFKFVTLDHQDVDDPTRSDNGIIRAEFRLAKQTNGIKINPQWSSDTIWYPVDSPGWESGSGNDTSDFSKTFDDDTIKDAADWTFNYHNSTGGKPQKRMRSRMKSKGYSGDNAVMYSSSMNSICGASAASFTQAGATVEGGHSGQSFSYSHLEVESRATILQLKIVGIKSQRGMRTEGRFCTQCGSRLRKQDKYCAGCGRRI